MIKVMCVKAELIPAQVPADERVFSYFKGAKRAGVGTIANRWHGALKRGGFRPSIEIWDFVQFCLAVCSADLSSPRRTSADGWTRNIQLTVGLCNPDKWLPLKSDLEDMLKALTGDYWLLNFNNAGMEPPQGDGAFLNNDCVSLLSGGLDSLIGGIDLVAKGRKPLFVSQLAHKDSERQRAYATMLMGNGSHYQWSHGISFKGSREPSTRGRSLAFYAFALLASTKINLPKPTIFIPENGVISINPPLVPGRVSSLSTRTTHPMFIDMLQRVLDTLGIHVQLELPYRFKTKGEMMRDCLDQDLLQKWAAGSTSCGRFRTYNRQHCGRCVPCLIRRAAFLAWNKARDVYAGVIERNVFTWLVTTSPKAFQATSRVLKKHESVLISPGLHPEIVIDRFQELEMLLELIQNVAAVGEVGLDGSKRYSSSYAMQLRVFSEVVRKCQDVGGRAISIHSRQAVPDVLATLKAFPSHGVPILHWFTGTATELRDASAQGCWFSIGPAAFNSAAGKALATKLPKHRVVPESDGPFAQFDNRTVMPWDFNITVRLLSEAWSMPENDVKLQLLSNTKMLLGQMGDNRIALNF